MQYLQNHTKNTNIILFVRGRYHNFDYTLFSYFKTKIKFISATDIDAHGLKIQGRGYLMFFAEIPRGVKAFRKNCLGGGSPYFGFYCIFINKCFVICLRGVLYLPAPLPHLPPPLCASMVTDKNVRLG